MKHRLIVNPAAGDHAAARALEAINTRLRAALPPQDSLDIVMTAQPGDARRAGEDAARAGYDSVLVGGGDGTLNEALNGVAAVPGGLARVTFGLVPLGTGNDFARVLGIPEDPLAAVDALTRGRVTAVDVGVLDDVRAFVNVSAGGFIAEVSDAVDPALKTVAGKLAYLIGGAQVLFDYEPVAARVHTPDVPAARARTYDVQMFAVCNSRLVGGGRPIAPDAVLDDGLLDVCVVRAMPTLEFVGLLREIARGEHVDDARVEYFRAREVAFEFARPVKVNTDGEVLEASGARYRVMPRAARFVVGAHVA